MRLMDKVKDAVGQNAGKIERGIDKAASAVEGRAGAKHAGKVGKVRNAAKDTVGKLAGDRRRHG